ncbi:MAG: nuclease-related domain-containing protein [Cyanobacteriota bacterium]|nr:nuclease-related domain-containing protein [Cyanobacteriota bacterium]
MKNHNKQQAGEFVRQMSVRRRHKAICFYGIGFCCSIGMVLFLSIFQLSGIGLLFGLFAGIAAYSFWQKGKYWMRRSEQALVGAKAEQEVAVILSALSSNYWQIEYNFPLKRWGDADVVLCSPQKNWYVVDVKSHKGKMINQDERLKRMKGRRIYDFSEGDLLSKVRGQAADVARLKQAKWVTAILCFTQAQVKIPQNQMGGVYIVEKIDLIRILEDLENK